MRSIELFAGCGAQAYGVSQAGFDQGLVIERDTDSIATLESNKARKVKYIRNWNIYQTDSRDLDFSSLGKTDLLSAGPPCQPFSLGGKHLGHKDERDMWPEIIRAIRELNPRSFLIENVRGILRPAFSKYLEYLLLQLSMPNQGKLRNESDSAHHERLKNLCYLGSTEQTYKVVLRKVNSADYGASQKRHRVFVIGISNTIRSKWEFPKETHSMDALVWSKYIDYSYWKRHNMRLQKSPNSLKEKNALIRLQSTGVKPKSLPWVTIRDTIHDLPRASQIETPFGHNQQLGARIYKGHTGSPVDEPSKALKAGNHGAPGGENILVARNSKFRYFTIREMARLQGLPDDYLIVGSRTAATRQLGNAVPTQLAHCVAKSIFKALKSN